MTTSIQNKIFLGPPVPTIHVKREEYPDELNQSLSLEDSVFCNPDEYDPDQENPSLIVAETDDELPSDIEIIDSYKKVINDHCQRRAAFFFHQLIVCYRSNLHFEQQEALAQGESAPALKGAVLDQEVVLCKRNAAHSATLPCLIAYEPLSWANRGVTPPEGFVYLKDSDYYRMSNSTISLPRQVNEADIAIDGTSRSNKLRVKCLALLNEAAAGNVSPDEGIRTFLALVLHQIQNARTSNAGVQRALELYHENFSSLQQALANDHDKICAQLLDVQIDDNTTSATVRKTIFNIRYQAIQELQFAEAEFLSQYAQIRDHILSLVKKNNKSPNFFPQAFLSNFIGLANTANRPRFLKLFSFPNYDLRALSSRAKVYDTTLQSIQKHNNLIQTVVDVISKKMQDLRFKETDLRSKTLCQIRASLRWSQRDLSSKIKELYPDIPCSHSTISRMENPKGLNGKLISVTLAEPLANVFHVDRGLFVFDFFYA